MFHIHFTFIYFDLKIFFPGGSVVKYPPVDEGDVDLTPGLGRLLGEGNGNPLQYACLGNPMDRGTWWITIHRVTKELDTT